MDVKNTISREEVEALEQWALEAKKWEMVRTDEWPDAILALCETVREMQAELAESTRFTLRSGVEKFKQQQSVDAAVARAEQAEREHQEYRDENARLRQALSQYQQPGALVRYGVQHTPDPWLLKPMEDGYWTPWHIANADVARLTAERDAARAEVAEANAAIEKWVAVGNSIMRIAVGREAPLSDSDVEGVILSLRAELAQARAERRDETAENLSLRSRLVDGDPQILDDITKVRAARDEWIAKHAACVAELEEHEATIATLREQLQAAHELEGYADHLVECGWRDGNVGRPCSCGLNELLDARAERRRQAHPTPAQEGQ